MPSCLLEGTRGTHNDTPTGNHVILPKWLNHMRGLYGRVAAKCGVHPSYVSRVARGERNSPKIEAMREMLKLVLPAKPKAKKVKLKG